MPVSIKKNKGGSFTVRTPHGIKAKHTTKSKAIAQRNLLNAIEHNPNFKPRNSKEPAHRRKMRQAVSKKY